MLVQKRQGLSVSAVLPFDVGVDLIMAIHVCGLLAAAWEVSPRLLADPASIRDHATLFPAEVGKFGIQIRKRAYMGDLAVWLK